MGLFESGPRFAIQVTLSPTGGQPRVRKVGLITSRLSEARMKFFKVLVCVFVICLFGC